MTEPVKCKCGRKATVQGHRADTGEYVYYAICSKKNDIGQYECWEGPVRLTERGAVNAWNKVMEVK